MHQKSDSNLSGTSSTHHLVSRSNHDHMSSIESIVSAASLESLQRSISPPSALSAAMNREPYATPETASRESLTRPLDAYVRSDHVRQGSADSLGLSPAPRPTRSPIARLPSLESVSKPDKKATGGSVMVEPRPTRPVANEDPSSRGASQKQMRILEDLRKNEFVVRDSSGSGSARSSCEDLDITGWLSRQPPDGSMPSLNKSLGKSPPSLSAVASRPSVPRPTPPASRGFGGYDYLLPQSSSPLRHDSVDAGSAAQNTSPVPQNRRYRAERAPIVAYPSNPQANSSMNSGNYSKPAAAANTPPRHGPSAVDQYDRAWVAPSPKNPNYF